MDYISDKEDSKGPPELSPALDTDEDELLCENKVHKDLKKTKRRSKSKGNTVPKIDDEMKKCAEIYSRFSQSSSQEEIDYEIADQSDWIPAEVSRNQNRLGLSQTRRSTRRRAPPKHMSAFHFDYKKNNKRLSYSSTVSIPKLVADDDMHESESDNDVTNDCGVSDGESDNDERVELWKGTPAHVIKPNVVLVDILKCNHENLPEYTRVKARNDIICSDADTITNKDTVESIFGVHETISQTSDIHIDCSIAEISQVSNINTIEPETDLSESINQAPAEAMNSFSNVESEEQRESVPMEENQNCFICKITNSRKHSLRCYICLNTYHQKCMKMPAAKYKEMLSKDWTCTHCSPDQMSDTNERQVNDIRWGKYCGITEINSVMEEIYMKLTTWKTNLFELPRGKCGKDYIEESVNLLRLFNQKTSWEPIALSMLQIFPVLMLQKPSARSKNSDHKRYLTKRLRLWKEGKLTEIISEAEEIQRRITTKDARKKEDLKKGFTRLMLLGKVRQALKLVDCNSEIAGVYSITEEIRSKLESKHPNAVEPDPTLIENTEPIRVEEVIFDQIDGPAVQSAAKLTHGSGGPTRVDADFWKHILCSKVYGKLSADLAHEISLLARRLCREKIPHEFIKFLYDCRLVALRKEDNGVRPIRIGETLRRIVGKCLIKVTNGDIQLVGGTNVYWC